MLRDTDMSPLESKRQRTARKWFESIVIITSLGLGGGGVGYWAGARQAREDCGAEIERLRMAYDSRLSNLTGQVSEAAETATSAAIKADSAATAAQSAAKAATEK